MVLNTSEVRSWNTSSPSSSFSRKRIGPTWRQAIDGFDLLALDAARLVDLLDRHLAAGELHVTVLGDRAGQGAGNADLDGIGRIGHGN